MEHMQETARLRIGKQTEKHGFFNRDERAKQVVLMKKKRQRDANNIRILHLNLEWEDPSE